MYKEGSTIEKNSRKQRRHTSDLRNSKKEQGKRPRPLQEWLIARAVSLSSVSFVSLDVVHAGLGCYKYLRRYALSARSPTHLTPFYEGSICKIVVPYLSSAVACRLAATAAPDTSSCTIAAHFSTFSGDATATGAGSVKDGRVRSCSISSSLLAPHV